jgi:hypothetical protein
MTLPRKLATRGVDRVADCVLDCVLDTLAAWPDPA